MAISRVKVWIAGEVLTASDLNAEFNNILNNAASMISPLGGNLVFTPDATYDIGASGLTRPRNLYLSGAITAGGAGAFSGALSATNLALATGTITTSQPKTLTQTWNAGGVTFTAMQVNVTDTASAAASLLADLQVGGVSQWKSTKGGATTQLGSVSATSIIPTGSTVPANGMYLPSANTLGWATDSTQALNLDLSGNFTSMRGSMGYGTGAGGAVTQLTSKGTAVTLNKPCGQITMNNATLNAGAKVGFALSNSFIGPGDTVVVTLNGAAITGSSYRVWVDYVDSGGTCIIILENYSGSNLSQAVVINFAVIKSVSA